MKFYFFTIFILVRCLIIGQPNLVWVKEIKGFNSEGHSIKLDSRGNIYTIGHYSDTIDIDPGPNIISFISKGSSDLFISKTAPGGSLIWSNTIGGKSMEVGSNIAIDSLDNVIISGGFADTVDFDPGNGVFQLISRGALDIFVCKLNSAGNFVWAKNAGGSNNDLCFSMACDYNGNIFTTGYFKDTADFDPGPGTYPLITPDNWCDIFISKLDKNGNFLWAKQITGLKNQIARDIACDLQGNVVTTGVFFGTCDFDPSSASYPLTSQSYAGNIFACKLDSSGNFVWAKAMFGDQWNEGQALALDLQDNVYLTGQFMDTCDFDPGPGINNLISNSYGSDVYICKLSSSGNLIWAKSFGGSDWDIPYSITVTSSGQIYTTGMIGPGNIDYDPGPGTYSLNSNNGGAFLNMLDLLGNFVCAGNMGGTKNCIVYSLTSDKTDELYITGFFDGSCDLDPGFGLSLYLIPSTAFREAFISKITGCSLLTKMEKTTNSLNLDLYPNPTNGKLILDLSEPSIITIYNCIGAEILNCITEQNKEIDLSEYPKGIYFVEIKKDNYSVTKKIILN